MPELVAALEWIRQNATVAALLAALAAFAWPRSRDFILDRLLAAAYERVTARTQGRDAAEREAAEAAGVQRERLRGAVGVLCEGLAMNLATAESRVKIAQSMAVLRADPRLELDEELRNVIDAIADQIRQTYHLDIQKQDRLTAPIIAKVRPLL